MLMQQEIEPSFSGQILSFCKDLHSYAKIMCFRGTGTHESRLHNQKQRSRISTVKQLTMQLHRCIVLAFLSLQIFQSSAFVCVYPWISTLSCDLLRCARSKLRSGCSSVVIQRADEYTIHAKQRVVIIPNHVPDCTLPSSIVWYSWLKSEILSRNVADEVITELFFSM